MNLKTSRKIPSALRCFALLSFLLATTAVTTFAQSTVEICNDGIDNDGDGLTDCADDYCTPKPADGKELGCECFDGVDNDDPDNLVDIKDPDCASFYGATYVGSEDGCPVSSPDEFPFEAIGPPAVSGQNTADTQSKVAVGDVDGNGFPDVVITSKWNSEVRLISTSISKGVAAFGGDNFVPGDKMADFNLDGSKDFDDCSGEKTANLLFEHEVLIADIDKDGDAEIFTVVSNRKGSPNSPPKTFYLLGLRLNDYGPKGLVPLYNGVCLGPNRPGTFGIADMDGDGKAEIYMRDRIYAAETGALLATGNGNWDLDITSGPVAVNIQGSDVMELVCGTKIFSIPSLTNRNPGAPGALTLVKDMNTIGTDKCYVKMMTDPIEYGEDTHSMCSVADIDRDNNVDVVISGALNSTTGKTAVFYWNVAKNTFSYYLPIDPGYANGWPWGTGRVNIGDANGDGRSDLTFIAGARLHCLTTDGSDNLIPLPTWSGPRVINDSRSGVLTVTIYDFNNDGEPEIVYRDSQELAIIDGTTGTNKLWSTVCQSHTYTEGPVIADADGDGATDICVACNRSNSFDINDGIQQQALGEVRMFFTEGDQAWLPTRKVWNQPGYFVVNINDDLTLPFPQIDQSLVFSDGDCDNGLEGPQMPMNVFLNQVPYLNTSGCPVFPAPDLSFVGDDPENLPFPPGDPRNFPAVVVTPPICGNRDVSVVFNIINDGQLPISDTVAVSFFRGDPTQPGITSDSLLFTTGIQIINLGIGDTLTTNPYTFNGPGEAFRLYIVLNNNGSVLPIDLSVRVPNECRLENNMYSVWVEPTPFTVVAEKVKDNTKCNDADPNDGEVRVRIFKGVTEVTDYSPYTFSWRNIATNTVVSTSYNAVGVAEGDYEVTVFNSLMGCGAIPDTIQVDRTTPQPLVTIQKVRDQTQCSPPNGELNAVVAGGNTGYTFTWLDFELDPLGISGPVASGLLAGTYIVRASKNGCTWDSPPEILNGPVTPLVTPVVTQHVIDCAVLQSGSVSATAIDPATGLPEADQSGFVFEWFFHDGATTVGSALPPANGTGAIRTGLASGFYAVRITETATQCTSAYGVIEVLNSLVFPVASIQELRPQTSCDPDHPNGQLIASVTVNGAAQPVTDFTFEWFKGDNTLPANLHTDVVAGTNGSVADSVSGGGVFYTVKVTTANNCSDTEKFIISENIKVPVVTLTPKPNGICDPALAAGGVHDGNVNAVTVTFDGATITDFTNYEFTWHDGQLTTDAVIPVADNKDPLLDNLDAGFYTVTVERTDLFCTSLPVTAEVINQVVLPNPDVVPTNSSACSPAATAGKGSVIVNNIDGNPVPNANYTIAWYNGITATGTVQTTNPLYSNLLGTASFTVLVTNTNTGCQNTETVQVLDQQVIPLLTLTPTHNAICDATLVTTGALLPGGVSTAIDNIGANPIGNYSFSWNTGATTQNITGVVDGTYTITVTHTPTLCVSAPTSAQVLNQTILPVLATNQIPSTACDITAHPSTLGTALVSNIDGNVNPFPAKYTYEWFDGNAASGTVRSTAFNYTGMMGGPTALFTVRVTNRENGCRNTQTVQVADARVLPLLTLDPEPNRICDPALTPSATDTYNGQVLLTVDNVIGDPNTNYTYSWNTLPTATTTKDLMNVNAGTYTVVATQTLTKCISDPVSAQVVNDFILPAIVTDVDGNTICVGTPNGQVQITTIDLAAPTTPPYAIQWFDGLDTTIPISGETNALLDELIGGVGEYYTTQVINQLTGCLSTASVEIPDLRSYPTVTLSAQDNTLCVGSNGEATVATLDFNGAVASPYTGFTFAWGGGTGISESGFEIINKPSGTYTLTVTENVTQCATGPYSIDILDDLFIPAIDIAVVDQTSCDENNPNGQLTATVDETILGNGTGITAGYSFVWTENGNTIPLTFPGTSVPSVNGQTNADRLGNLYYAVQVTRTATGCKDTATVFLPEVITYPVVVASTTSPVTRCDTPNGSVSARVGGIETGYTFFWLNEAINAQTNDPQAVMANADQSISEEGDYVNLKPGDYTVVALDNITQCYSQPETQTVTDNTITSNVDILPAIVTPAVCGLNTGVMQATITGGVGPGFDVFWYRGGPVDSVDFYNFPQNSFVADSLFQTELNNLTGTTTASSLNSALYSILVIDKGNGCGAYDIRFLPFADPHNIVETITNSTLCMPAFNGQVDVALTNPVNPPGSLATFNSYEFYFYEGSNVDPAKLISGPQTFAAAPVTYNPLEPGFYTIQVFENYSGNHCPVIKVIEIEQDALNPLVDLVGTLKANTACNLNAADGSAEINISQDPDDALVGITYTLNVSPAPLAGSYPVPGLTVGNQTILGLQPDNVIPEYIITVTSSNNCAAQRFITIPNKPSVAELVDGDIDKDDAEYCDPALEQSARIEVQSLAIVNGPADNLSDYRFDWYTNSALTAQVMSADGTGTPAGGEVLSNDGVSPAPASPVTIGSYWVVATKVDAGATGGVGCFSAPFRVDILDQTIDPVMTLDANANTACDVNYEGSIEADVNTASGPGVGGTYDYVWARPVVVPALTTPADMNGDGVDDLFTGVRDGFYTATATNVLTGCQTTQSASVVKLEIPVVVATGVPVDKTFCLPFNGEASAVANVIDPNTNTTLGVPSDFRFFWYKDSPIGTPIFEGVALDAITALDAGTYFVQAAVDGAATIIGSGCVSVPDRVDIMDKSANPIFKLTPFDDTSCSTTSFEGSIRLEVTDFGSADPGNGPGAYTYLWAATNPDGGRTDGGNGNGDGSDGDGDNPTGLDDGTYQVRVTNFVTGCFVDGQTTIQENTVPIVVVDPDPINVQSCFDDGSITVDRIEVAGVEDMPNPNAAAAYKFTWYRNSVVDADKLFDQVDGLSALNSIAEGAYFVKAKKNDGSLGIGQGCESAPVQVNVQDVHVDPIVSFTTIANTACDNDFDGQITLTANTLSGPGVGANYDLSWTAVPLLSSVADDDDVPANPYITLATDNVGPGDYTVRVQNRTTLCFIDGNVKLLNTPQPVEILDVTKLDQTICFNDGSLEVISATGNVGEYTFRWYKDDPSSAELVDAGNAIITTALLDVNNYGSIEAGTYYVVGIKNTGSPVSSGCPTAPYRKDIEDVSTDPRITFDTPMPNSSCNTNYNGELVANATEFDGSVPDPNAYDFTWTLDGIPVPFDVVLAANTSTYDSAQNGNYVVEVLNTTTGCVITSAIELIFDPSISKPNIITVDPIMPINCDALADGSAEVTGISIGGGPTITGAVLDTDFEYEWYNDPFSVATIISGQTNPLLSNLDNGTYYVLVKDLLTDCKSEPTEVVLTDDPDRYPVITIEKLTQQVMCTPGIGTGELRSLADGQNDTNPDYQFEWFNNLTATPLGGGFATTSTVGTLIEGDYSVSVLNSTTGCRSNKFYILPNDSVLHIPKISVSGEPRINCINPDGTVQASLTNLGDFIIIANEADDPLNYPTRYPFGAYNFDAVISPPTPAVAMVKDPAQFSWVVTGQDVGTYTVVLTDLNTGCDVSGTHEVIFDRHDPEIVITVDNPLINCDEALLNGQLSATADGQVGASGYSFEWYKGTVVPVPGTPLNTNINDNKLIGVGVDAGPDGGMYVVRVTNNATNCFSDLSAELTDGRLYPNKPVAFVMNHNTSCVDPPNGWVRARVVIEGDSTVFNHDFLWYDNVPDGSTSIADPSAFTHVQPDYFGLPANPSGVSYAVTATDQVTGCVSPPALVKVEDRQVIPVLALQSTPSYCEDVQLEPHIGRGSVLLNVVNDTEVILDEIVWTGPDNTEYEGAQAFGLWPGTYTVSVVSSEGCTAEGEVEVKTDIFAYNLVSVNGDESNDTWIIECISLFENNNVKVFNRAGILVYEADHYDNFERVFKGIGEIGIYPNGKVLPDGTYFFIIDKRDGSKPVVGYLELVR